jgi:Spy/CpxP family protein refolding chaperone
MTKQSTLTLLLALALVAIPTLAQPAPAQPGQAPHERQREDRFARQLNLTEAQQASIKAIRAKHADSMEARHKAMETARTAYHEARQKPETKPEELKALHRTVSDLAFDMQMEHQAMRKEIGAQLTPEQREKAAYFMGRMAGMRGKHHEHGPWGHDHEGHRGPDGDGPAPMKGADAPR